MDLSYSDEPLESGGILIRGRLKHLPSCLMALYERLRAKDAELAYNAAKGRILKKLAGIKIVKNRSALYEIDSGKPQKGNYEAFK